MNNLKTKIVSLIALVSLAGSPIIGFAQTSPAPTSSDAAKAAVEKALQDLKAARESFRQAKQQEADAQSAETKEHTESGKKMAATKRADAEKRKMEHRKDVLLRLVDIQIKHLNNVEERVQRMPNIMDAKKAELKTEIDKEIAGLNDLKTKVQVATTDDQLKELAKQLRDYIKSKNDLVKKIVDAITADALKDLSARAADKVKTAEAKIAELKTAGKDVTQLESLLATAKSKLDAANAATTREAWSEAKDALRALYEALKEFTEKAEKSD